MSRKAKARRTLERSRKKGMLKAQLKLSQEEIALAEARLSLAAEKYENAMIVLYCNADATQRAALETEFQQVVGYSLKRAQESHILAALSKAVARRL
jgi:hypothetical protein